MTHAPFEPSPLPEAIRREIEGLTTQVEGVRGELGRGFDGLTVRMDATIEHLKELNGRTRKNELAIAVLEDRGARGERHWPEWTEHRAPSGEERGITQREVKIVLGTLSAAAAVVVFVWKVLPLMLKAVAP